MPRASSSAKRQQGATSHRDTKHENGLVVPGKRIAKHRSQNQILDGNPDKPAADNAPPPSPSIPAPSSTTNGFARHPDEMPVEHRTTEALRRASLGTYSGSSSTDSLVPPSPIQQQHVPEEPHRRIDVNDAKNNTVHRDPGPLDIVLTVLRSSPLADTIAILIILMQVSPVSLTTIYMLFAFLTFVPPVTTSSGLSITDIFDGNQGTPALGTLVCMDIVMILIWLFLWAPMQQFILDLAQVFISMTLGGGASSKEGTANNVMLCVAIVMFTQWTRHWGLSNKFSHLNTLFGSTGFLPSDPVDPLASTSRAFEKKGPYGWVRSVLAIHIVTQGLVRYIREWYLRREKRDVLSQSHLDPEAGKAASLTIDSSADGPLSTADADGNLQSNASTVSSKKRRKQSAQVRIRQPLWAALASTKIVMVKEYELSHAASESAGSNATDIHNLGNAPFNTQPEQIWICYVGCDEVCFNTSHFPPLPEPESSEVNGKAIGSPRVDTNKPFYVKVNNAVWQPTRIVREEGYDEEGQTGMRWTGDIYGLTPLSNYECEFISTRTGQVLFSTSVRTLQAKTKDPDATKAPGGQRSQPRHDSPATTLKASIAASEAKLAELKTKLKNVRKDNKTRTNNLRKEIEKLSAAAQSAGGNDEKLRQKITQNSISQKQAEAAIAELDRDLKELETIPEDALGEYRAKKAEYDAEKATYDGARASFKSFKSSMFSEVTALESESTSLKAKRNKIASRLAKLDKERDRIVDANSRGLDEAERKRQDRAALEADISRHDHLYQQRIAEAQARNIEKSQHAANLLASIKSYVDNLQQQSDLNYDVTAGPAPAPFAPSPWNQPATLASLPAVSHLPPPQPTWQPQGPPILPTLIPPQVQHHNNAIQQQQFGSQKARARSSSMLSNVSGFTQSSAPDDESGNNTATVVPLHGHPNTATAIHAASSSTGARLPPGFSFPRQRQRSDGGGSASGSASGSGSGLGSGRSSVRSGSGSGGSVRDPTSPI